VPEDLDRSGALLGGPQAHVPAEDLEAANLLFDGLDADALDVSLEPLLVLAEEQVVVFPDVPLPLEHLPQQPHVAPELLHRHLHQGDELLGLFVARVQFFEALLANHDALVGLQRRRAAAAEFVALEQDEQLLGLVVDVLDLLPQLDGEVLFARLDQVVGHGELFVDALA
jgi:hypothetical protein